MENTPRRQLGFNFKGSSTGGTPAGTNKPGVDPAIYTAIKSALEEACRGTGQGVEKAKLLTMAENASEETRVYLGEALYVSADADGGFMDGAMSKLALLGVVRMEEAGRGDEALASLSAEAWDLLARKAVTEARKKNVVLTRTLAPLLNGALWVYTFGPATDAGTRHAVNEAFSGGIGESVEAFAEWLQAEKDPAVVAELVKNCGHMYWSFKYFILKNTPLAGEDGIQNLLAPGHLNSLSQNPHLQASGRKLILDCYIENIAGQQGGLEDFTEDVIVNEGWLFNSEQLDRISKSLAQFERELRRLVPDTGARTGAGRIAGIRQVVEHEGVARRLDSLPEWPEVLKAMARSTKGRQWARAMERLVALGKEKKYIQTIAKSLQKVQDWQMEGVDFEDLLKLVEHGDDRIRAEGRRLMVVTEEMERSESQVRKGRSL